MAHVEMAGHTVLNTSLSEERSLESSFHVALTRLRAPPEWSSVAEELEGSTGCPTHMQPRAMTESQVPLGSWWRFFAIG